MACSRIAPHGGGDGFECYYLAPLIKIKIRPVDVVYISSGEPPAMPHFTHYSLVPVGAGASSTAHHHGYRRPLALRIALGKIDIVKLRDNPKEILIGIYWRHHLHFHASLQHDKMIRAHSAAAAGGGLSPCISSSLSAMLIASTVSAGG